MEHSSKREVIKCEVDDSRHHFAIALRSNVTTLLFREFDAPYRAGLLHICEGKLVAWAQELEAILKTAPVYWDLKKLYEIGSVVAVHPDIVKLALAEKQGLRAEQAPLRIPIVKLTDAAKPFVTHK